MQANNQFTALAQGFGAGEDQICRAASQACIDFGHADFARDWRIEHSIIDITDANRRITIWHALLNDPIAGKWVQVEAFHWCELAVDKGRRFVVEIIDVDHQKILGFAECIGNKFQFRPALGLLFCQDNCFARQRRVIIHRALENALAGKGLTEGLENYEIDPAAAKIRIPYGVYTGDENE